MRHLPSSSLGMNDLENVDDPIRGKIFQQIDKELGFTYAFQGSHGASIFFGTNFTQTATTYSDTGNLGSAKQLYEWRPVIKPVRKLQDEFQAPYVTDLYAPRRMLTGSYYAIISGIGSDITASINTHLMYESSYSSLGGDQHISGSRVANTVLTFGSGEYNYQEEWVLLDEMTGSVSAPISGFRSEALAKVAGGGATGYLQYLNIEEARKVNPSTYAGHVELYGSEWIAAVTSSVAVQEWDSDNASHTFWMQATEANKPIMNRNAPSVERVHSLTFDGINDHMIADDSSVITQSDGIYVGISIYVTSFGATRYVVLQNSGVQMVYGIYVLSSGQIYFLTYHGAARTTSGMAGPLLTANTWYDIAAVVYPDPSINGYSVKELWINGALYASTKVAHGLSWVQGEGDNYLGSYTGGTNRMVGHIAMPVVISVDGDLSGSFGRRDVNALNLTWRRAWTGIGI